MSTRDCLNKLESQGCSGEWNAVVESGPFLNSLNGQPPLSKFAFRGQILTFYLPMGAVILPLFSLNPAEPAVTLLHH